MAFGAKKERLVAALVSRLARNGCRGARVDAVSRSATFLAACGGLGRHERARENNKCRACKEKGDRLAHERCLSNR